MLNHRMGDVDFYYFSVKVTTKSFIFRVVARPLMTVSLEAWRQIPRRAAYTNIPTTISQRHFSPLSVNFRPSSIVHRPSSIVHCH